MSNHFKAATERALNRSLELAQSFGHTYIGTEHILLALAEDDTYCACILLKEHSVSAEKISLAIKELSGEYKPSKLTVKDSTPRFRKILNESYAVANRYYSDKIGTEHLLYALLDEGESVASKILKIIEADIAKIKESVATLLKSSQRED